MRLNYPSSIKIVKVPCTGRVAVIHLMRALEKGADGVFVAGCMEGDCKYQLGNIRARKRVEYVRQLLESIGMAPDRVAMYNMSSGEGPRFAEVSREMTEKVRKLGPNPIRMKDGGKEKAA